MSRSAALSGTPGTSRSHALSQASSQAVSQASSQAVSQASSQAVSQASSQASLDDPFGLLGGLGPGPDLGLSLSRGLGAARGLYASGAPWPSEGEQDEPAVATPDATPDVVPTVAKIPMVLRARARKRGLPVAPPAPEGAPPSDAVAAVAAAQIRTPDACPQCGGGMRRRAGNPALVCDDCGLVVEGDTADPEDDDAPREAPNTGRLRLVGPGSGHLQPDLYRSGSGTTAATQKKQILDEYKVYRQLYIEAGGRAFPFNALEHAAEFYNAVQKVCVKRSQNKAAIMATCLKHGCLQIGFAPTRAELAAFMQLKNKGIARGGNFVHSLVADGKMDLEVNADPSRAEIMTLFAALGFEDARYAGLQEAVFRVVHTAIDSNIGTSSVLRSKVAGATYAVLRRCRDRALIPKTLSMQEFCGERIRKNTIERFTRELDDYHSYFEPVYAGAGLDSAPIRKPQ